MAEHETINTKRKRNKIRNLIILLIFVIISFKFGYDLNDYKHKKEDEILVITKKFNLYYMSYSIIRQYALKCTFYTNTIEETDNTPNITASNRPVCDGCVAISRDLIQKYKIKYGDVLYINELDSYFSIEDTMNPKIKNGVDIFVFTRDKKKLNKSFKCSGIVYKWLDKNNE